MDEPTIDLLNAPVRERQCSDCQKVKPLTIHYFAYKTGTTASFKVTCRECLKAKKLQKGLNNLETKAVKTFLNEAKTGGSNIPHTAELLESVMGYFGGTNGFSSLLMKQYVECQPGSRQRNAILEMIFRLASKNAEMGGSKKPVTLLSDEELEGEINKRLEEAALAFGGKRYINAPQEPAIAAIPPADSNNSGSVLLSTERTEDFDRRIEREAARSLEALQANSEAVGVPPVSGE